MNAAATTFDGENKYIRITDIDDTSLKYKSTDPVSPAGNLNEKYLVNNNDILFARTGASTGKSYLYDSSDGKLYFAGFLIRARIKDSYNSKFIFFQTQTQEYNKWIKIMSMRSGQPGINSQEYANFNFFMPPIRHEQDKIVNFITRLNEKILSQNKIIEELKLLKSILCIKMFSLQLRFRKNNIYFPNWNVSKLNDLLSIPEKVRPSFIDKNKLLTVKLHSKGVLKNDNTDTLSLGATNYFIRKKGQFIYGKQNLFNGAFGLIPDHLDGFLSSGDVPVLDININKINRNFLIYYFSREIFYKKLENIAIGSGSKRIHENTLLNITIMLPCLEEQNKIAQFLTSIDKKIDIEIKVAQKLEKQKNFLLQHLFI